MTAVQTSVVCALQGGVEGVVVEVEFFQMLKLGEGGGEVGKSVVLKVEFIQMPK